MLRMKLVTEAMSYPLLPLDVPRVVAVRIGLCNLAVAIVNLELGPRVAAHLPAAVDGLELGLEMPADPIVPPRRTSQPPAELGTTWWVPDPRLLPAIDLVSIGDAPALRWHSAD